VLVDYEDTITFTEGGAYLIRVTAYYPQMPCFTQDSMFITEICQPEVYVPEAFSPNGDGTNDVFKIFGKHYINMHVKIFNRWNEPVFYHYGKTPAEMEFWDGTVGGQPAQDGVYQWIITYNAGDEPSKTVELKGMVTIIR